jgi:CheY-like chemotaxis protein
VTEPAHARLLFVDDEPRILDGLRRSLRGMRGEWDMRFATSGFSALEMIAEQPCDVLISDMRMPGMGGAELLTRVREQHPGVARVVLSGHTEPDAAVRAAFVAHRFLNKPCEVTHLTQVVRQLTAGLARDNAAELRAVAGALRTLPSPPRLMQDLTAVLGDPGATLGRFIEHAHRDVALTAKVLQLANSAFYGARPRVVSVDYALATLGLPMIRALLAAEGGLWSWPEAGQELHDALLAGWEHSVAIGLLAPEMASPALAPFVEVAASLRDVGMLAAAAADPHTVCDDLRRARREGRPVEQVTTERAGFAWSEVGAELLNLWGLPQQIVTAVATQDQPARTSGAGLGVHGVLRAAHLLLRAGGASADGEPEGRDELESLLQHPQLRGRATDWRQAAERASRLARQQCRPELSATAGAAPAFRPERSADPLGITRTAPEVLVVDDDESIRQLLVDILEMEGFSTRSAGNGQDGLTEIGLARPDCVVLDVMMPGISGLQVLERIRALPGQPLPVIMLTAATDSLTSASAWTAGADFFLVKPFEPDELLNLLSTMFLQEDVAGL